MADTYIDAQNLTEDTSLDGEEQFVMFDDTMGKRAKLKNIKTYMNADVAKPDGDYPDLKVGNADVSAVATAIAGGSYTEESVPYKFRHTGGDITAGEAEEDCIVGGTIAWNQQINESWFVHSMGSTMSIADGVYTITATGVNEGIYNETSGVPRFPKSHKFLVSFTLKDNTDAPKGLVAGISDNTYFTWIKTFMPTTNYQRYGFVFDQPSDYSTSANSSFFVRSADTTANFSIKDWTAFDLTQMFGSAVADYIYNLEQSSAGKGVAFFRSMFPEDYYEYNAGELKSVSGLSAHVTTGFNLWDEEWERGAINTSTGQNESTNSQIRTKNYIHVLPSTAYRGTCISMTSLSANMIGVAFYDAEKNFIGLSDGNNNTFTTPSNCSYMRLWTAPNYGTTYNHDICINLSSDRNGEYEPYKKHSYALDSSLTLRGVPQLVNNKVCFDGDEYRADGSVTRKYQVLVLNGSESTWSIQGSSGGNTVFRCATGQAGLNNEYQFCTHASRYYSNAWYAASTNTDTFVMGAEGNFYIQVSDSIASTVDAFKALLASKPMSIVWQLATPTTETASAYVNPQACDEYGTEEYVSTSIVPVGHTTKYYDNLVKRIDMLPSMITSFERSATASTNYSVGDYLIMDNTLYKVTSAISTGGTITAGTNVTATTIMAEIKALQ